MTEQTIYQFPLNERIRVFLRLEHLFAQLDYFLSTHNNWNNQVAIHTLVDIITLSSRGDLKSEILKELDYRNNKHHQTNAEVPQLNHLLTELKSIGEQLQKIEGKIGTHLLSHYLFQGITQRSAIAGGSCSFDLPALHFWLEQPEKQQYNDFQNWMKPFLPVRVAINLILSFLRQRNPSVAYTAKAGFFQMSPNNNQPYQLLIVSLPITTPYFAEFSGGKHRFSLRFMQPSKKSDHRPKQTQNDVNFELNCCLF